MKKAIGLFVIILMMVCVGGIAYAHCGHCGIESGYVCSKCNMATLESGKCCGGDKVAGDVKEVVSYDCSVCGAKGEAAGKCAKDGTELAKKVAYVPAPAEHPAK